VELFWDRENVTFVDISEFNHIVGLSNFHRKISTYIDCRVVTHNISIIWRVLKMWVAETRDLNQN
jgi:hypothetical protein